MNQLNWKDKIALFIGKLYLSIFKNSSSASGFFSLKISASLLNNLLLLNSDKQYIFITGTNGKSTTAGFLASIFREAGKSIIHNYMGANLPSGLLTALLKNTSFSGHIQNAEIVLLEIDEAILRKLPIEKLKSKVLVNNFFRDQLDRFGELEQIISLVQEGIKNSQLFVNADDPNVCRLKGGKIIHYGLKKSKNIKSSENHASELALCPRCNSELIYIDQWLGQFGDFHCGICNYQKPEKQVQLEILKENGISVSANFYFENKTISQVEIPLPSLFNAYNALGAVSVALDQEICPSLIKAGIENYKTLFGRSEKVICENKLIQIFLIKNPLGATEVLKTIKSIENRRILILVNDNYADGIDVSWLWDAYFEYLSDEQNPIFVSGKRGREIAIRLKYAGVKKITYYRYWKQALKEIIQKSNDSEMIFVLPTYTALMEMEKSGLLKKV